MKNRHIWLIFLGLSILTTFMVTGRSLTEKTAVAEKTHSFDQVEIVYSCQGEKEPVLIFIHGGFANRHFWKHQLAYFKERYRVITVDLGGHGESGDNRQQWGLMAFGKDVGAVIEHKKIKKAILIGNSLGGPVALQTAQLIPERVVAVVAVDTFHLLNMQVPATVFKARANAFRKDFSGTMKQMVRSLFHPGSYPELLAYVEKQMLANSPEMAAALMESFAGIKLAGLVKGLRIPIRCINGDLYPTQIKKNREIHRDFDAVILPKTGHYPMLENPELFNKTLEKLLIDLTKK